MKTFEENLNAWLEGRLSGEELVEFEASLPKISAAELDEQDQELKLGALLKEHLNAPALTNEDFFNHQLRTQIASESRSAAPAAVESRVRETWWSIGRLLWTGAASLAVFVVCTFFIMREQPSGGHSALTDKIMNTKLDPVVSPNATVSIFPVETEEAKVTVLWLEGLQSLPSEYAAK